MEDNSTNSSTDGKTIVQGDQNIFRDNSRLVKIVLQGVPQGCQQDQYHNDRNVHSDYPEAEVLEAVALEQDAQVTDETVSAVVEHPEVEMPKLYQDAPKTVFRQVSEFTRLCVKDAMDYCYKGQPTQLAYVMITCFAYELSNNLSSYKAFVRSLMYWQLLPYEPDVTQIANTMGVKVREMKTPDFRKWDDSHIADRTICEGIGQKLEARHCRYRYTQPRIATNG